MKKHKREKGSGHLESFALDGHLVVALEFDEVAHVAPREVVPLTRLPHALRRRLRLRLRALLLLRVQVELVRRELLELRRRPVRTDQLRQLRVRSVGRD